jgi:hypothetical protein
VLKQEVVVPHFSQHRQWPSLIGRWLEVDWGVDAGCASDCDMILDGEKCVAWEVMDVRRVSDGVRVIFPH